MANCFPHRDPCFYTSRFHVHQFRKLLLFGVNFQVVRKALEGWLRIGGYSPSIVTYVNDSYLLPQYDLNSYKLLFVPSSYHVAGGGIDDDMNKVLLDMKEAIAKFVNVRGK